MCILISFNIKKLNLILNNNLLENNEENMSDVLKRLVMFSKMFLFLSVIAPITYVITSLINSLPSNKHEVHVVYIVHVHVSSQRKDRVLSQISKIELAFAYR